MLPWKNSAMGIFFFVFVTSLIVGCGENEPSSFEMAAAKYVDQFETADSLFKLNWLSATDNSIDTNAIPTATTICGWVLLNHLDVSLLILNRQGASIGYIDHKGRWTPPPGQTGSFFPTPPDTINQHLRQLASWVINTVDKKQIDIDTFFKKLNNEIEYLEGSSGQDANQFNNLSVLISKPLALVRASIKTEILLRLKDYPRLNDGLVAYWIEDPSNHNYRDNNYYTRFDPPPLSSSQEVDAPSEIQISMLLLSPDLYEDILATFELSIFMPPLLLQNKTTNTPLQLEDEYEWSWNEVGEESWINQTVAGHLSKKELKIFFPNNMDAIWARLIDNNSLTLLEGDNALITLSNSTSPLSEIAPEYSPKLEEYLKKRQVNPLTAQELKEGWLKLKN